MMWTIGMADSNPDNRQSGHKNEAGDEGVQNEAGDQGVLNSSAEHDGPSSEDARNAVRNLGDRIEPAPQNNEEEEEESKQIK